MVTVQSLGWKLWKRCSCYQATVVTVISNQGQMLLIFQLKQAALQDRQEIVLLSTILPPTVGKGSLSQQRSAIEDSASLQPQLLFLSMTTLGRCVLHRFPLWCPHQTPPIFIHKILSLRTFQQERVGVWGTMDQGYQGNSQEDEVGITIIVTL